MTNWSFFAITHITHWRLLNFFAIQCNAIYLTIFIFYRSSSSCCAIFRWLGNLQPTISVSLFLFLSYFSSFLSWQLFIIHSLLHNFYAKLISRAHIILPPFVCLYALRSRFTLFVPSSFFVFFIFFRLPFFNISIICTVNFSCLHAKTGTTQKNKYPKYANEWGDRQRENLNNRIVTIKCEPYTALGVHETIERMEICIWKYRISLSLIQRCNGITNAQQTNNNKKTHNRTEKKKNMGEWVSITSRRQ